MSGRRAKAMRVLADPSAIAVAIRAAYLAGKPSVVTYRALRALAAELGSMREAVNWLARLVAEGGRPLAVNIEHADGSAQTIMLGPPGWSRERLAGHAATMAPHLERAFGPVERIGPLP